MLPSEHPEFWQRPPPPGQSRESGIRIDGTGRFWHRGELVQHPGMQAAFATWITRHPADGRPVLCNGYDWSYFDVEDVPYFVRGIKAEGAGLEIALSDGSREVLDPATLRSGAGGALYCAVREGAFEARFTPQAQTALLPFVAETEGGEVVLRLAGTDYVIRG